MFAHQSICFISLFPFFPHLTSSLSYYPLYHSFSALVFCSSLPYREIVHFVYFYFPLLIFFLHSNYFHSFHQLFCLFPSADFLILFSCTQYENDLQSNPSPIFVSFCIFFGRTRVCWPQLCLCRPFCIFERCLDSNPESYKEVGALLTQPPISLPQPPIAISNFPIIFSLLLFPLIFTISSFPPPFNVSSSPFRFM